MVRLGQRSLKSSRLFSLACVYVNGQSILNMRDILITDRLRWTCVLSFYAEVLHWKKKKKNQGYFTKRCDKSALWLQITQPASIVLISLPPEKMLVTSWHKKLLRFSMSGLLFWQCELNTSLWRQSLNSQREMKWPESLKMLEMP